MVKKQLKGIAAAGLAFALALSVAGCGGGKAPKEESGVEAASAKADAGKTDAGKTDAGKADAGKTDTGETDEAKADEKSASAEGDRKYWSATYTFPTKNGDVHPYLVYNERRIDAPFTPDDFFEGCPDIRCGYKSSRNFEYVEKASDIANFKDGDLNWLVRPHDFMPIGTDGDLTTLQFLNLYEKAANPGLVYRDMAFKVAIDIWKIFRVDDYESHYSPGAHYIHKQEDIENIYFKNFGMPTTAYETYVTDNFHDYVFLWETNAYTVSAEVVEFKAYSGDYPTNWVGNDVVYYSANYPKDMLYKNLEHTGSPKENWTLLWDNGPVQIEWDGAGMENAGAPVASGAEKKEIKVYKGKDLQNLELKGTLSVDKIDIVYNDVSCTVEPGFSVEDMLRIFGEQNNEVNKRNIYKYGTSANQILDHRCPVEFEYAKDKDGALTLREIGISLETAATLSIMGIDYYTSAEELAEILGTPSRVGDVRHSGTYTEQEISWRDFSIGGFDAEFVAAYYFNGELTEIVMRFK